MCLAHLNPEPLRTHLLMPCSGTQARGGAQVQRVSCDPDPAHAKPAGNQTWDWQEKAGKLVWRFKRLPAGADATLRVGPCRPCDCSAALSRMSR